MGRQTLKFLTSQHVYACAACLTHLSVIEQLISRQFHGQHGKAFLFEEVDNIVESAATDRTMTTGLHTVRDISCCKCGTVVGWKYDRAYDHSQKFKEGRFILEKNLLCTAEATNWGADSLDYEPEIVDAEPRRGLASLSVI